MHKHLEFFPPSYCYIEEKDFEELRVKYPKLAEKFEIEASEYLESLELTLNGKTQIFPFKNGVNYLGFHTYVTENGKVIRRLKNENKRNAQRKYLKMAKLVASGTLPIEKFNASYNAWLNHISHGNCYKMSQKFNQKIQSITGDKNNVGKYK